MLCFINVQRPSRKSEAEPEMLKVDGDSVSATKTKSLPSSFQEPCLQDL